MRFRVRCGYSLVETLVVISIICILMALYLPTLSRALQKARDVRDKEALHQRYIGEMAGSTHGNGVRPDRAACRAAYRQQMDEALVTEMLYVVRDEGEFVAYWNTLIRRDAFEPLEYTPDGSLIAKDAAGNTSYLPIVDLARNNGEIFPMAWVFISTDLSETSAGNIGSNVLYSDGHGVYERYPGEYPMTSLVAQLSHAFVTE